MNEQLDEQFIKRQKTILLKEKQRLKKELYQSDKFPMYGNSDEDNSAEVTQFSTQQGMEKELRVMFDDVSAALENIKKGKYGICSNCGQQISKNRLVAFPAASLCEKCNK